MKHIILSSILLILFNGSLACSCFGGKSFCNTHSKYDLTASCVVIDTFPHGISLKILHLLHGSEIKDTIIVWDLGGPYDLCNDSLTDASAAFLGSIGDTLILALPKINTIKNAWDVVGDYRTPGFQCDAYHLRVINHTVLGFISGSEFCSYLNNCLTSYNYNDYIIDFPIKSLICETWLNTNAPTNQELLDFYPNPAADKIIFTSSSKGTLAIKNHFGQFVDAVIITDDQTQIPTGHLPTGIYFLTFQTERNIVTRKLVIQQ